MAREVSRPVLEAAPVLESLPPRRRVEECGRRFGVLLGPVSPRGEAPTFDESLAGLRRVLEEAGGRRDLLARADALAGGREYAVALAGGISVISGLEADIRKLLDPLVEVEGMRRRELSAWERRLGELQPTGLPATPRRWVNRLRHGEEIMQLEGDIRGHRIILAQHGGKIEVCAGELRRHQERRKQATELASAYQGQRVDAVKALVSETAKAYEGLRDEVRGNAALQQEFDDAVIGSQLKPALAKLVGAGALRQETADEYERLVRESLQEGLGGYDAHGDAAKIRANAERRQAIEQAIPSDKRYEVGLEGIKRQIWSDRANQREEYAIVTDLLIGEAGCVQLQRIGGIIEGSDLPAEERRTLLHHIEGERRVLDFRAASGDPLDKALSGSDAKFEAVTGNQSVRDLIGEGVMESFRERAAEHMLSQLLVSREHDDYAIKRGCRLLEFKNARSIPLTIMNFWREPGYSGEMPFISIHAHDPRKTYAFKFVSSLTERELAALRERNIPGLMEVIEIVRTTTPETDFRHSEVERVPETGHRGGEFVENPTYARLRENLGRTCLHFIRNGTPEEQVFSLGLMEYLDKGFMEKNGLQVVEAMAAMSEAVISGTDGETREKIRGVCRAFAERVVRTAEYRNRAGGFLITRNYERLKPAIGSYMRTHGSDKQTPGEKLMCAMLSEELNATDRRALSEMTGVAAEDIEKVNTLVRALGVERDGLGRRRVEPHKFQQYLAIAKTEGALGLVQELGAYGFSLSPDHAPVMAEMVASRESILQGVRVLSALVPNYRYEPQYDLVYNPETRESEKVYTADPYISFAKQAGMVNLFSQLEQIRLKQRGVPVEITDGLLASLTKPRGEGHSREFNQAINTLVSAFMVENGALSGCRGLLTPTFLRRVAENPVEYTRNLLEFGGLFGQALEQAGRDEQLRRLGVSEKIADLLSQPRGNLEEIAKILKGGEVGAVHILTGLAVAWPLAKDPKNTVRVAKSLEGMLKTSSGNLNHMLTHGLGFFFENNLVADAASFEAVATGLAGVSQRNASNEVWELMKKFMPPAYRDDAVPAMELGGELATFGEFVGEFGATNIPYLYTAFRRMKNGLAPPAELASSGITSSGSKGVRELKDAVRSFRRRLIADDRTLEVTNPLELDLLKALTRFEEGQWRSGEGLSGIAARLSSGIKSGAVAQAPAEYTRGTIRVARLDAQSLAEFQFAPDTSRVLEEVRTDVRAVKGKSVQQVVDESREAIITGAAAEIRKLEETIPRGDSLTDDDRRRQKGIQQKIDNYRRLISGIEGKKTAAELVETVASWEGKKDNPITTPILRRLLISHGLTQLSSGGREFLDAVESPLSDGIGRIIEFYDSLLRKHVLGENQDLPGHLKLPKPARKRAQGAITQGLLKQEYERRMNIKASGEDEFLMMPSRGVLGELSGTICDACWAGRSDILRGMPNMVPVIFVRSPDTPAERIAGATLLLEAQTAEGEKAIVIRGFNPLQNVITELNTQSFFESFADWLAPIARARGAKKILVVGGTRGGAMTNRPDIATYVGTAYGAAQDVALADQPQTTFNNYDIRNACKLVREIT